MGRSASSTGRNPAAQRALWKLDFRWLEGPSAVKDKELLQACAELFSEHYGIWGSKGHRPGERIRIPDERVATLLKDETAWLAAAFDGEKLVGYLIAERVDSDRGRIDWVSQLVVHQ